MPSFPRVSINGGDGEERLLSPSPDDDPLLADALSGGALASPNSQSPSEDPLDHRPRFNATRQPTRKPPAACHPCGRTNPLQHVLKVLLVGGE